VEQFVVGHDSIGAAIVGRSKVVFWDLYVDGNVSLLKSGSLDHTTDLNKCNTALASPRSSDCFMGIDAKFQPTSSNL
jgi:hypothetical protein